MVADGIAIRFDNVSYTAAQERLLAAVLAHPSSALLSRAGVRPGPGGDVTVGGTPEAATVTPFGGIITDAAGGGSYIFVVPASVATNLATRPGAGTSRIDELVVVLRNVDERIGDVVRDVDVQIITGAAGASPVAPTIPAGQLRIRELLVPASGSVSISKRPPRVAAAGGTITVTDQAERDAISPLFDGIVVYREDTDTLEVRANGAWRTVLLDKAGDDTWADVPLGSGFAHAAARTQAIRHAGQVTLAVAATKATIAAGSTVCTLDPGFRPSRVIPFDGVVASNLLNLQVNPDGTVVCNNATTGGVNGTVTFPPA